MQATFIKDQSDYEAITNPTARNMAEQLLTLDTEGNAIMPNSDEPYEFDERKGDVNSAQVS